MGTSAALPRLQRAPDIDCTGSTAIQMKSRFPINPFPSAAPRLPITDADFLPSRSASEPLDAQLGFSDGDLARPILCLRSRANENSRRPNRPNRPPPCASRPHAASTKSPAGGEKLTFVMRRGGPRASDVELRRNPAVASSTLSRLSHSSNRLRPTALGAFGFARRNHRLAGRTLQEILALGILALGILLPWSDAPAPRAFLLLPLVVRNGPLALGAEIGHKQQDQESRPWTADATDSPHQRAPVLSRGQGTGDGCGHSPNSNISDKSHRH
jgi:hypothetical protein